MSKEDQNLQELLAFENANEASMTRAHNGNRLFTAKVTFNYKGLTEQDTLNGKIEKTGYTQGNVTFVDGIAITAESHHTEFIPKFNDWKYDGDSTLTITGNSPKLGRYKALITI